ncbi:hypothetical protein DUT90_12345 [Polaribacter sp. WD7]|uniref:hypothetical protein n=1 Tax=Polaribacter sp. WD7 TaxID=2269061 RepID=UPI000DF3C0E2|nr:hypothetical protein [Polaribacter sp. WD7]RCS26540.1 hypothetical protein DUT90_12345 [Polaribacter sp. WD7]
MSEESIKKIIKKYKSGTSTIADENFLFENVTNTDKTTHYIAAFIKESKLQTPRNLNNTLWDSFEKKTKKKKEFKLALLALAASVVLIISVYINNKRSDTLDIQRKEALLNEAKSMFKNSEDPQIIHHIIIESDLLVVYTKTEK